jgi:hypothetical protein
LTSGMFSFWPCPHLWRLSFSRHIYQRVRHYDTHCYMSSDGGGLRGQGAPLLSPSMKVKVSIP